MGGLPQPKGGLNLGLLEGGHCSFQGPPEEQEAPLLEDKKRVFWGVFLEIMFRSSKFNFYHSFFKISTILGTSLAVQG